MSIFTPGLVHTPVTPFTRENKIEFDTFEKLIEFLVHVVLRLLHGGLDG